MRKELELSPPHVPNFLDRVLDLLLDELQEGLSRALAPVLLLAQLAVLDVLEGGILGDVKAGAQRGVRVTVHPPHQHRLPSQLQQTIIKIKSTGFFIFIFYHCIKIVGELCDTNMRKNFLRRPFNHLVCCRQEGKIKS
jgi:hypothetical protein